MSNYRLADEKLFEAVLQNNAKMVTQLLNTSNSEETANINATDSEGNTPLLNALKMQHFETVHLLLKYGADVTFENNKKESPIKWALKHPNKPVVKIIINQYIKSKNITSLQQLLDSTNLRQILSTETKEKRGKIYKNLSQIIPLSKKALKALNKQLQKAAGNGELSTVKCLLNPSNPLEKPDINTKDSAGWTPLILATSRNKVHVMQYLLEQGADINAKTKSNQTALHWAIFAKSLEATKFLIEHGADFHIIDSAKKTLLHWAIECDDVQIVEYLISLNLNVHQKTSAGYAPIHYAAKQRNHETVELLVKNNANVNMPAANGITPLIVAVATTYLDPNLLTIKELIKHGADVNLGDNDGNTPLIKAIKLERTMAVKELIKNKADITKKNNDGQSPLLWAYENIKHPIAKIIIKAKKTISPEELKELHQKNQKLLKQLLIHANLLSLLKKQPYEQQINSYILVKHILSPEKKKEFENYIRMKRQKVGEKQK